jgi:repeat uncharacterized protein DUF346
VAEEARPREVGSWIRLGGRLTSGPAAAEWGTEETEAWAIAEDGHLRDRYWDGASWHDWDDLGAPEGVNLVGEPAASARDPGRVDVFAAGDDGALWHRWWDGSEWVPWRAVEGAPRGVTAVAAQWAARRLELYVRDANGELSYGVIET